MSQIDDRPNIARDQNPLAGRCFDRQHAQRSVFARARRYVGGMIEAERAGDAQVARDQLAATRLQTEIGEAARIMADFACDLLGQRLGRNLAQPFCFVREDMIGADGQLAR